MTVAREQPGDTRCLARGERCANSPSHIVAISVAVLLVGMPSMPPLISSMPTRSRASIVRPFPRNFSSVNEDQQLPQRMMNSPSTEIDCPVT